MCTHTLSYCLKIPEILQEIFAQLLVHKPEVLVMLSRPHGAETLSRLAQTCQRFSDPALNLLWRSQFTLIPLLKTFPPNLWEMPIPYRESKTFRFLSPITPADWTRVLSYARRIRTIYVGRGLPLEVAELLNVSLPVDHLLPNLLDLIWESDDPRVLPYISLFLGTQITSLTLTIQPSIAYSSLLTMLTSKLSSLTNVTISWSEAQEATPAPGLVSSLVQALPRLQSLYVPHLDPPGYRHLASLSALKSLSLYRFVSFGDPAAAAHPAFPRLTSLYFYSPTINSAVTALVDTFSNTPLGMLECESEHLTSAAAAQELFTAVAAGCSHSHLRMIYMNLGDDDDATNLQSAGTITPEVLAPLLVFSHLRDVTLNSSHDLALDDAFCAALGAAWPRIEYLDLIGFNRPRRQLAVGLPALAAFARHCPYLTTLGIELNAQPLPAIPDTPLQPRVSQQALSVLRVGHSSIGSPFLVAGFLSVAFPGLSDIVVADDSEEPDYDGWAEVQRLLPMFVAIRREDEMYHTAQTQV
ncbi:hypothetical protein C8R46DRAFT_1343201 [Mycena filopes]|nr:hypothetical protein C8R46DRAFT_1343201 [Mycena filopes]